jgi:hypothetical protein
MLEPDHHAGGADDRDDMEAGDAVRVGLAGEELKAQVDRRPGGLGGPEQDGMVDLVGHGFTLGHPHDLNLWAVVVLQELEQVPGDRPLTGRPAGPVDLDHPLAAADQHPRQPRAIAARTLDRKAAAAGDVRAGELQQPLVAGPIGDYGDLPKQATNGGGGRRGQGVAVGVDADNAIDLVS